MTRWDWRRWCISSTLVRKPTHKNTTEHSPKVKTFHIWCQTWSLHHIRHTNWIWIFCPLNKENIGKGRRSSCTEYAINFRSTTGIKIPFTSKSPALIIVTVTEKLHNSTSYRLLNLIWTLKEELPEHLQNADKVDPVVLVFPSYVNN